MIKISIKADMRALQRKLDDFKRRQLPFAMAQALNATAKQVIDAESKATESVFQQPRQFTKNAFTMSPSFGGQFATKRSLVAVIVAKPIQAAYLAPSEFNEVQHIPAGGKRHITPVNVRLNSSNDIPRGTLQKLLAQPDCFLGVVHGVNGIWQRPSPPRPKGSPRERRGIKANRTGRLKLLIAFTRPVHIKPRLEFHKRASDVVQRVFEKEFDAAFKRALVSAR